MRFVCDKNSSQRSKIKDGKTKKQRNKQTNKQKQQQQQQQNQTTKQYNISAKQKWIEKMKNIDSTEDSENHRKMENIDTRKDSSAEQCRFAVCLPQFFNSCGAFPKQKRNTNPDSVPDSNPESNLNPNPTVPDRFCFCVLRARVLVICLLFEYSVNSLLSN
jgi:hypothetical protein